MDFFVFIITIILYFPLSVVNFLLVRRFSYLKDTGVTLSKVVNRDLRTLLNKYLKTKGCGYEFGSQNETVSCVLGKNQISGTLSSTGVKLVLFLHKCEKHHCLKSVKDPELKERAKELMNS